MTIARMSRTIRWATLAAALALLAAGGVGSAQPPARWELRGACYCRAKTDLMCVADMTERACTEKCRAELCDDWFWLERRPCWNWGYGG
jgi:hypothetical protein